MLIPLNSILISIVIVIVTLMMRMSLNAQCDVYVCECWYEVRRNENVNDVAHARGNVCG